jgi:DNA-binding NtrC family response regulator
VKNGHRLQVSADASVDGPEQLVSPGREVAMAADVLIVDDDQDIRDILQVKLEKTGVHADMAASAEEALAMMNQRLYSVVLADIHMPGMSGVAMVSALKKISPLVQVIMLTADSSIQKVLDCVDRGAADFFSKECQLPLITDAVATAVERVRRWKSWVGTKTFMPMSVAEE